jgi:hypothetical protein
MKTINSKAAKKATQAQAPCPIAPKESLHVTIPQGSDSFVGSIIAITCRIRTKDELGLIYCESEQNIWLGAELSLRSLRALAFRLREVKLQLMQEYYEWASDSPRSAFWACRLRETLGSLKISVEANHASRNVELRLRCSGNSASLSLGARDTDCLLYAVERVITKFETNAFTA